MRRVLTEHEPQSGDTVLGGGGSEAWRKDGKRRGSRREGGL